MCSCVDERVFFSREVTSSTWEAVSANYRHALVGKCSQHEGDKSPIFCLNTYQQSVDDVWQQFFSDMKNSYKF